VRDDPNPSVGKNFPAASYRGLSVRQQRQIDVFGEIPLERRIQLLREELDGIGTERFVIDCHVHLEKKRQRFESAPV
jgi:hypothetical protein